MDLTSSKQLKDLLAKTNSRPSKGLGQNFLVNKTILTKIVQASNLSKEDMVLEIGPGMGVLTKELATHAKKVVAIEKDAAMVALLKEHLHDFKNVEIVHGDALAVNVANLGFEDKKFKVVANIPYYITSPLIRKLLESPMRPNNIILMVQKEVAQRICAKPPKMSLLAISVQCYATAKILFTVPKNSFWPSPKVDSAVIEITPNEKSISQDMETFFKIVKAGFSQPRKQLINNFSQQLEKSREEIEQWLWQCSILPNQRAETLNVADWLKLSQNF